MSMRSVLASSLNQAAIASNSMQSGDNYSESVWFNILSQTYFLI